MYTQTTLGVLVSLQGPNHGVYVTEAAESGPSIQRVTVYLQKASVAELQAKGAVVRRERGDDNEARTRGHEEGGQPQVSWAVHAGEGEHVIRDVGCFHPGEEGRAPGWRSADAPLSCVPVVRWRSTRASCTSARRPRTYVILIYQSRYNFKK
jgi:hypothetical protein